VASICHCLSITTWYFMKMVEWIGLVFSIETSVLLFCSAFYGNLCIYKYKGILLWNFFQTTKFVIFFSVHKSTIVSILQAGVQNFSHGKCYHPVCMFVSHNPVLSKWVSSSVMTLYSIIITILGTFLIADVKSKDITVLLWCYDTWRLHACLRSVVS